MKAQLHLFWSELLYPLLPSNCRHKIVRLSTKCLNRQELLATMFFDSTALLCVTVLELFAQVQTDYAMFSQFIGAMTAIAPGSADSYALDYFTICTN